MCNHIPHTIKEQLPITPWRTNVNHELHKKQKTSKHLKP